jgi:hypothetical protein
MQAKWIPACAGMTRYGARRTGSFKESEISRVVIAHGAVSGTKDEAKLPPPPFLSRDEIAECNIFLWIVQRQDVGMPLISCTFCLTRPVRYDSLECWL